MGAADAATFSQSYVAKLYERQMRHNAEHLRSLVSAPPQVDWRKTRVLFRTSPPGYPTADLLTPDTTNGVPPVFTAPSRSVAWVRTLASRGTSRYNHHMLLRLNELARRAFSAHGETDDADALGVMDVEAPMLPRVDGHLDPLHYCLPGPTDFYSEVLFNFGLF